MTDTWIVATSTDLDDLRQLAESRGPSVRIVAVGVAVPDAEVTLACPPATPVEALAAQVADLVAARPGDAVLFANTAGSRALAGAVAARHDAPVFTGVRASTSTGFVRERHGGLVLETVTAPGVMVAVSADAPDVLNQGGDAGVDAAGQHLGGDASLPGCHPAARIVRAEAAPPRAPLREARRVVVAGRGFRTEPDLALARSLARAWDAELACTRPLADGLGWLPADRCVGLSGARVAPELYVTIGVSGQLHHLAAALGSGTILAINTDAGAPVFGQCDYGIVGDLYAIVPQLIDGLEAP